MDHKTVNDARDGTRDHGSGVVDAIAHRIAGADLDRNTILVSQLHEFQTEWNDIAVNIRARDILKMAARADSHLQAFLYDAEIVLHSLTAAHVHFIINVVVGAGDQNTCLAHSH